ncbi:hypothetical protein ACHAW5_003214 [Stephanodiscus triporus]|uniref:Uncharacterized protein n=1 Tax=Stephanodiscus triporus TaxID=2934178 RepID=A0ABD3N8B7_9STRA
MRHFVNREATGVFVWALLSCVVRSCLSLLASLSTQRPHHGRGGGGSRRHVGTIAEASIAATSVLARWALSAMPPKVAALAAPGFSFGSTWILYPLKDRYGLIPNLPCRFAEAVMGRLSPRELLVILPIHFLVPAITFRSLQLFIPSSCALESEMYSEESLWLVDVMRETFVNALFTVGLLVIPELLRINGIRRGFALLILYPVYSFGVDADGKASIFGPNVIYSLSCANTSKALSLMQSSHLIGPMLGGILGGKIMSNVFPDDK